MANTYFQMLQAVENYYGAGSDQWLTMANWTGYQSTEVAGILQQVPGITTYTNEAGELLSYSLEASPSYYTAAQTAAAEAAGAINSNTVAAEAAVQTLSVPANVVEGATAGTVEITSGASSVATGSRVATVLGHAGTWVIGAAVGMKLGVWIDNLAYNAAPDFWEARNWGPVNPELWKSTKITNWLYDYSGYDDFMCLVDDEGQMYVDEQVLALAAQYLAVNGCFEANEEYCTDDDLDPDLFFHPEYKSGEYPYYVNEVYFERQNPPSNPYIYDLKAENNTEPVYIFLFSQNSDGRTNVVIQALSKGDFDITGSPFGGRKSNFTNRADDTIYTWTANDNWNNSYFYPSVSFTHILSGMDGNFLGNDLSILLYHGYRGTHGKKEGFHPYAPTPQGITSGMTGDDIINLLKQQYPQIWNPTDPTQPGPIKQGVLQDDGTITDRIYIPVPIPDGGTEGQPETTPQTPQKPDPENPVSTQTVTRIINPTPNPTENPNPPETGSGNTPAAPLPTGSASALYKIYNPTEAQIQSFGAWLWSSNFVDQLLKIFNDPMQAIISLHKIYATPHTGGTSNIKVGYLDSGVPSKWVDQQYIDVDCGNVTLLEKNANVFDYAPFVDVRIYLPFVGIVSLDVADVMRGTIGVKYRIDVITGTLIATVSVTRDAGAGGVMYQYTGSMAENYPLSSGSYMGIITGMLGLAAGIAGTVATGGAAAPALLGGAAGLTALRSKVEHSNGFSGNAGALACKKPYLIISRQQTAMSNGVDANIGMPTNSLVRLDQCSGMTKVKAIHLRGVRGATDGELDEIIRLLTEGVII